MARVVRATIKGVLQPGVETRNVFTYQTNYDGAFSDIIAAITPVFENMLAALSAYIVDLWHGYSIQFEELVEGVWQPRGEDTIDFTGENTSEMLPAQVSALVVGITGWARTLAKKYLPPFGENNSIDGTWHTLAQAALVAFAAYYGSTISIPPFNSLVPGTVSKLGVFHQIMEVAVRAYASTQRRRKPGVGI